MLDSCNSRLAIFCVRREGLETGEFIGGGVACMCVDATGDGGDAERKPKVRNYSFQFHPSGTRINTGSMCTSKRVEKQVVKDVNCMTTGMVDT